MRIQFFVLELKDMDYCGFKKTVFDKSFSNPEFSRFSDNILMGPHLKESAVKMNA